MTSTGGQSGPRHLLKSDEGLRAKKHLPWIVQISLQSTKRRLVKKCPFHRFRIKYRPDRGNDLETWCDFDLDVKVKVTKLSCSEVKM